MKKQWTAEEIKRLRKRLGMTQQEFAQRLGITTRYVTYLESGQRVPSQILVNLLTFLEKEAKWIKTGQKQG